MTATNLFITGTAAALLCGLLLAEREGRRNLILGVKTACSCAFVATAILQEHPLAAYFHWVLAGLLLGLVGDVCLALRGDRAFRAGLVAFLLGHVAYVVAFALVVRRPEDWLTALHLLLVAVSCYVLWWLWPRLGAMRGPVVAYVLVISAMVAAAISAAGNPLLPGVGRWTLLLGAVCFYLSDLCVARDRFVAQGFANRLLGLPLYYGGQFLIAFSVGLVG